MVIINPIHVITNFVLETYPVSLYPKVLEIAAGSGVFSKVLSHHGYQVTSMDPKLKINLKANYQQCLESFAENTDISEYDFGVAFHPCGIHHTIINNFKVNEKALFLIPCCTFSCDNRELHDFKRNEDWLDYLHSLNPEMKKERLFNDAFHSYANAFYTRK